MAAILTSILAEHWQAIGGALMALLAFAGAWFAGSKNARQKAKIEALRGNVETRERIDNAEIVGDDPALARRWLRERQSGQP